MKAISLRLSTLIAALAIGLTQLASASNPVIDWNQIALSTALTTPGTQIYLTYVNLAMYDAVNAIDRRYQQYGPEFHGPGDASKEAAAISAAYQTLKAISLCLSTLIAALAIGLTQLASASNPVIDWNQIALSTALTTPGTQIYLAELLSRPSGGPASPIRCCDCRHPRWSSEGKRHCGRANCSRENRGLADRRWKGCERSLYVPYLS